MLSQFPRHHFGPIGFKNGQFYREKGFKTWFFDQFGLNLASVQMSIWWDKKNVVLIPKTPQTPLTDQNISSYKCL